MKEEKKVVHDAGKKYTICEANAKLLFAGSTKPQLNSNMSKLARSCIEMLPDELWFEVFIYTSSNDLCCAWRNLNTRINAILRSVPIRIHITSKSNEHIHIKNMLANFPLQILHAKDERVGTTPSLLSRSEDLLSLVNIRSLYLAFARAA